MTVEIKGNDQRILVISLLILSLSIGAFMASMIFNEFRGCKKHVDSELIFKNKEASNENVIAPPQVLHGSP